MKKVIILAVALVGLATTNQFNAQTIYGGAQLGFKKLGDLGSNIDLGINGDYATDQTSIRVQFNYGLPIKQEFDARLVNNSTQEGDGTVAAQQKITLFHLAADFRYFFGSGSAEESGFYGIVGAGLHFYISSEETTGSFNSGTHSVEGVDGEKETNSGFAIRAGVGYDYMISDNLNVFAEILGALPANQQNGQAIAVTTPGYLGLTAGIRIPLNF